MLHKNVSYKSHSQALVMLEHIILLFDFGLGYFKWANYLRDYI